MKAVTRDNYPEEADRIAESFESFAMTEESLKHVASNGFIRDWIVQELEQFAGRIFFPEEYE